MRRHKSVDSRSQGNLLYSRYPQIIRGRFRNDNPASEDERDPPRFFAGACAFKQWHRRLSARVFNKPSVFLECLNYIVRSCVNIINASLSTSKFSMMCIKLEGVSSAKRIIYGVGVGVEGVDRERLVSLLVFFSTNTPCTPTGVDDGA